MAQSESWYVLSVRPGFEAFVTQKLCARGMEACALRDQSATRPFLSDSSTTGLVFVRACPHDLQLATLTAGVLCVLGVPEPLRIPDTEVMKLRIGGRFENVKIVPSKHRAVRAEQSG